MKRKMKFAARKYNRNLSGVHQSTLGFGQLLPAFACEQVIGDSVTIKPTLFARSAPQVLPNMASLSVSNRAFFCPFSNVWRFYNDFLQGNPVSWSSDQPKEPIVSVPWISQYDFMYIITDGFNSNVSETGLYGFATLVDATSDGVASQSDYDFYCYVFANDESLDVRPYRYYKLTAQGKQVLKIFHALDYNFDMVIPYAGTAPDLVANHDVNKLSALPLLCFLKVVLDYYLPSNLRPSSYLDNLFYHVNNELYQDPHPSASIIAQALTDVMLYHDSNYFTSQWLLPNEPAPNLSMFGQLQANTFDIQLGDYDDLDNVKGNVNEPSASSNTTDSYSQVGIAGTVGGNSAAHPAGVASQVSQSTYNSRNITFDQIKIINQLRAFIMRNNLVGSLPLQRLFARFGVKVPELQLRMSQYFGNYDVNVISQAVVSTNGNDGEDNSLGDLAGMSYVNQKDNHTFKFSCSENGYSFVISSLDVPSMYVSGINRSLRHLKPFSFYTPEFDDSIMQATRGSEIVGRMLHTSYENLRGLRSALNLADDQIFGYTKRYAEFKYGRSRITGDYVMKRLRNPIIGYVLPRNAYDEDTYLSDYETMAPGEFRTANHVKDFYYSEFNPITIQSESDAVQFNRIYRDLLGEADPFMMDYTFDVQVFGNVKNSELDEFIAGDGDSFEFEINGGHMN